jgi:hypothetical protein
VTAPAVKGPWFDVPAGTRAAECRTCHATIYWITTANDRKMPVDCDVDGGFAPAVQELVDAHDGDWDGRGRGVSHFATCPERDQWRKPR